jgi:hypothetical protein
MLIDGIPPIPASSFPFSSLHGISRKVGIVAYLFF